MPTIAVHGSRSSRHPPATIERLTKSDPHTPRAVVDSEHDVAGQARDALVAHVRAFIAGT